MSGEISLKKGSNIRMTREICRTIGEISRMVGRIYRVTWAIFRMNWEDLDALQ
jgi:hypothetical protein